MIAPDARPNEITLTRRVTGPHQRVRYKQVNHTARAIVCHPIFAERKYCYTRTFSSAIWEKAELLCFILLTAFLISILTL